MTLKLPAIALALFCTLCADATDSITTEPDDRAYHYVSHYSILIDASVQDVWPQLLDVGSWMYEFDLSLVSGIPGTEGEVRRLYDGQEFLVQITKVVPNELLVIANLPSTFDGEHSTGVAVLTLDQSGGATTVRLTMSRRYRYDGDLPNPQKAMRETTAFREQSKRMWQDRFLSRLKALAED